MLMMEHSLLVKMISMHAFPKSSLLTTMNNMLALLLLNTMTKDSAKGLNFHSIKIQRVSLVLITITQECIQKDAIYPLQVLINTLMVIWEYSKMVLKSLTRQNRFMISITTVLWERIGLPESTLFCTSKLNGTLMMWEITLSEHICL